MCDSSWRCLREKDLHEDCSTQSHRWAKWTQNHSFWRLHPDLSCLLTCIFVGDVSEVFQYNPEVQYPSMDGRIVITPRSKIFHLLKSRMKMVLAVLFGKLGMIHNELLCEGTLITLNSMYRCWKCYWIGFPMYRCWKCYWIGFQAWGHNLESQTVGFFCVTMPLCILPW